MAGNDPTDKPGALRGRIVDADGRVFPGALVFIKNINTGMVSNENGSYTLANLTLGAYLVCELCGLQACGNENHDE